MLEELTGGGGGQGFSAFGGAIKSCGIRAFGMLSSVVSHRKKVDGGEASMRQIYLSLIGDSIRRGEKKSQYGRKK